MPEWIVRGFYWEDWSDDEVPGVEAILQADSEEAAVAEYRRLHDPNGRSRVTATTGERR